MSLLNKLSRKSSYHVANHYPKHSDTWYTFEPKNNMIYPKVDTSLHPEYEGHQNRYPLHDAVASTDLAKLRELIASGRDVNERSGCGDTALILAAKKGKLGATKILVDAGCDVNATDNYKQSALYYAVTKYNIASPYNRNEDYPDMAALLIIKGAVSSPIRIAPDFFAKTVRTLAVKHEKLAEKFLRNEFHREMYRTKTDFINEHLKIFLSDKDPKRGLTKALEGLINIDFHYENKIEATTHLSHLNSWTGKVVDYDHQIEAEGWFMHRYPPLKVKNLLISLREIYDGMVDTQSVFNEPRNKIINKIVSEIESQLTTYYTQVNQDIIKGFDCENSKEAALKEAAVNEEVKMICHKISNLRPGSEFAIASGFPGHAIYIGFRKSNDGFISRRVYNLGAGIAVKDNTGKGIIRNHVFSKTGRIFPNIVEGISVDKFQNDFGEGAKYIKGVIEAKLGMHEEYLPYIYDNAKMLGGKQLMEGFASPAQKRQLAGNCVLKNNNAAVRNRLDNDALFKWLKAKEMKEAQRIAECYVFSEKEREKDILSLEYVVKEHNRSKDITAAAINFNVYFRKRLPLSQTNHSNPMNELSDFLKTNRDNPKLKTFLNVDGVKKLLDSILYEKNYGRSNN